MSNAGETHHEPTPGASPQPGAGSWREAFFGSETAAVRDEVGANEAPQVVPNASAETVAAMRRQLANGIEALPPHAQPFVRRVYERNSSDERFPYAHNFHAQLEDVLTILRQYDKNRGGEDHPQATALEIGRLTGSFVNGAARELLDGGTAAVGAIEKLKDEFFTQAGLFDGSEQELLVEVYDHLDKKRREGAESERSHQRCRERLLYLFYSNRATASELRVGPGEEPSLSGLVGAVQDVLQEFGVEGEEVETTLDSYREFLGTRVEQREEVRLRTLRDRLHQSFGEKNGPKVTLDDGREASLFDTAVSLLEDYQTGTGSIRYEDLMPVLSELKDFYREVKATEEARPDVPRPAYHVELVEELEKSITEALQIGLRQELGPIGVELLTHIKTGRQQFSSGSVDIDDLFDDLQSTVFDGRDGEQAENLRSRARKVCQSLRQEVAENEASSQWFEEYDQILERYLQDLLARRSRSAG